MTFKWRGVIEGFYGQPWTLAERIDMFDFMKDHKMNIYIYAPKNDPYHRDKWSLPYPCDLLADFKSLVEAANQRGIEFVFALSPGLSIDYHNDEHLSLLATKCSYLAKIGVSAFGLFLDDIPEEHTAQLAKDQSFLANRLSKRLKDLGDGWLLFCPTKYQGNGDHPYVRALGQTLDQNIPIMWTGPYVISPCLSTDDTKNLSEILRRQVFYWDNYPVNDASMRSELHIGPYVNREADLHKYCSGITVNPMPLAESSKIGIGTAAKYMEKPGEYDAEKAWKEIIQEVADDCFEQYYRFAEDNLISHLHPQEPERLAQAVDRFKEGLNDFRFREAVENMRQFFLRMLKDAAVLEHMNNKKLLTEAKLWLREYSFWAELGLKAINLMEGLTTLTWSKGLSQEKYEEMKQTLKKMRGEIGDGLRNAVELRTKTCGHTVRNFIQDIYQSTDHLGA